MKKEMVIGKVMAVGVGLACGGASVGLWCTVWSAFVALGNGAGMVALVGGLILSGVAVLATAATGYGCFRMWRDGVELV